MMPGAAARVLVVEDDADLRDWLCRELAHEGYEVKAAGDGRAALDALSPAPDLILLDVMLPGLSGFEVCRRLRTRSRVPVIVVTARDAVTDRVAGLDVGADDYLCKPFAIEELLARMRVQLRRVAERSGEDRLQCGPLTVDLDARRADVGGHAVDLTKTEFDLLAYLAGKPNVVRSREQILRAVWGYNFAGESRLVEVYVRYLRSKIDERFKQRLLHTVRGVGYVLRCEGEAGQSPAGGATGRVNP